jgi:hypothetical protein
MERTDGPGMDKTEIRHILRLAGGEKLRAAVALSREGKAVIVLDRHKPPRALERELKEDLPGSRLHRFGTLSVDEGDPRLARFVVNKASPGMARKLAIALRGTGLRRVEIGTEDGSEAEAAEDDEEEEHGTQIFATGRKIDHVRHAELHNELRGLIEKLPDIVSARRLKLVAMAEAARAELKQDRLEDAADAIAALRAALAELP